MSACAASVPSSSCSPLDALSPGNLGVWSAGDALHGQSVAPQLTTTDYPRSVASPTLSEHGNGGEGRQGRNVYSPGDKTYWELPKLPELDPSQAPLQAGDWLTVITPMMNDLAPAANDYWSSVLQVAERVYERWQAASPLLKAQPPYSLSDGRRSRSTRGSLGEGRGASLPRSRCASCDQRLLAGHERRRSPC